MNRSELGLLETQCTGEREKEYQRAKQDAEEAVEIGRETLTAASIQSEQITNASRYADEAQYALDKSARKLRGMTWSGWMANMFTKDVEAPATTLVMQKKGYDEISDSCQEAAQAVVNYRCNLSVLGKCETEEQKKMCLAICNDAYKNAVKEVAKIEMKSEANELSADLAVLRSIQRKTVENSGESAPSTYKSDHTGLRLVDSFRERSSANDSGQEEHLHFLSKNLGELNSIGRSLGHLIVEQNEQLDSVHQKADSNLHKSKLVTRKADQMTRRGTWRPAPAERRALVSISHRKLKKFLSVCNGALSLSTDFEPSACIFVVWKRQGNVIGLQNLATDRWLGQNLLGSLSCSSSSFGRREEWEVYDDLEQTRLLCASANWGAGGFIIARKGVLSLSGSGIEEAKAADIWCLTDVSIKE